LAITKLSPADPLAAPTSFPDPDRNEENTTSSTAEAYNNALDLTDEKITTSPSHDKQNNSSSSQDHSSSASSERDVEIIGDEKVTYKKNGQVDVEAGHGKREGKPWYRRNPTKMRVPPPVPTERKVSKEWSGNWLQQISFWWMNNLMSVCLMFMLACCHTVILTFPKQLI